MHFLNRIGSRICCGSLRAKCEARVAQREKKISRMLKDNLLVSASEIASKAASKSMHAQQEQGSAGLDRGESSSGGGGNNIAASDSPLVCELSAVGLNSISATGSQSEAEFQEEGNESDGDFAQRSIGGNIDGDGAYQVLKDSNDRI